MTRWPVFRTTPQPRAAVPAADENRQNTVIINVKHLVLSLQKLGSSVLIGLFRPASRAKAVFSDEELLRQAQRELIEAQNLFARAEDADMIDCAIYTLKAAETRFDYIYKRLKQEAAQQL